MTHHLDRRRSDPSTSLHVYTCPCDAWKFPRRRQTGRVEGCSKLGAAGFTGLINNSSCNTWLSLFQRAGGGDSIPRVAALHARPTSLLLALAIVGCRGGTPGSRPTPTSHPALTDAGRLAPSDGGGLVLRNYPLSIVTCIDQCHWVYDRCASVTPECDVFGRLEAALRSGPAGAYTDLILQEEVRNRADVCLTRCAEPERLCGRRCFDAVDAGPPVPQPLRPQ
jgi:hypothetical protein